MGENSVYHYTECGLDNVWLEGVSISIDDEGDDVLTIRNIGELHRVIAHCIVTRDGAIDGRELRFLRTGMGLTQAELGQILQKEPLTIGRWERGETALDANAETIVRLVAAERLGLDLPMPVEQLARRAVASAGSHHIRIDGRDPDHYTTKAA